MDRREALAAFAGSALLNLNSAAEGMTNKYLEIKTWHLHNSAEDQSARVSEYLQHGLLPAVNRAGASLQGVFSNFIGPDGPYFVTLVQYSSLSAMQDCLAKIVADETHRHALEQLSAGTGMPFVRTESSLLYCFDKMPAVVVPEPKAAPRVFELRRYESATPLTLARKVAMFNGGEMQIFQRLGMQPVFFGETVVGPRQPNLMYMLCYEDWAARDRLWKAFSSDPEWKKLSGPPEMKDAQLVTNIGNIILRPLSFSPVR